MQLESITLVNFKNFAQLEIDNLSKINCFVGNNGVGKTNLLDAIYYLSFSKSYFNSIDSENIKYDEDFFVIQGKYQRKDEEENIYCGVKRNHKKKFRRNKKDYSRLSEHIGLLPLVIITPSDIGLIIDASQVRRKFIDGVISQYDKSYLETLLKYNKVLEHRNKLLKSFAKDGKFDALTLEIWSEQLISFGTIIHNKRKEFINQLIPVFQKYYNLISEDKEVVGLEYKSDFNEGDFEQLLNQNIRKDRVIQYTSVGIHKDDLILSLDNRLVKKVGSQGQKKTYLLSLKLAQFDFIKSVSNFNPLMLFDDVFDKLDTRRVAKLIELVADNYFGQIFITDTSKERLENLLTKGNIDYSIFKFDNGKITE